MGSKSPPNLRPRNPKPPPPDPSGHHQNSAIARAAGGKRGGLGAFVLNPDMPEERRLPAAGADIKLPRDSVLRIVTAGGGGYGEAQQRDRISIERDLREGRITSE